MQVYEFKSIAEILSEWNSHLPQTHWLYGTRLLIFERSALPNMTFRYLLIGPSRDDIHALAYVQVLDFGTNNYAYPINKGWPLRWLEWWLMRRDYQLVCCGNFFQVDAPGVFISPKGQKRAKETIQVVARHLRTYRAHATLFKDFDVPPHWLESSGFRFWNYDSTMTLVLHPQWETFNDYLNALRHRYAQRARKILRKKNGLTVRYATLSEIAQHQKRIETLYLQVVQRQSFRIAIANGSYFKELKKQLGENACIFLYEYQNEIIAFRTELIHNGNLELHLIGIDYDYNGTFALFFNILFDAIDSAIRQKLTFVELGRTATWAKSKLGAQPTFFPQFIRFNGLTTRLLAHWLSQSIKKTRTGRPVRVFRGQ